MDTIPISVSSSFGKVMAALREGAMVSKDQLNMFNGTWIALVFVLLSMYGWSRSVGKRKLLPPGPRPLPVVGNLFSLGAHTHQVLAQLAKQYGNIMTIYFGSVRVVIVSDASMAKELFTVSDVSFANRPIHNLMYTASKYLNYGGKDGEVSAITCTYSPRVREVRQLCNMELFTTQKLELSKSKRMEEVQRMVATIKELAMRAQGDQLIETRPVLCEFGLRNSCRTLFNKAFLDSEHLPKSEVGLHPEAFRKWEEVNSRLFSAKNIADIIPFFRLFEKLDLQGIHAQYKYVNRLRFSWTTSVFEWYRKHGQSGSADDQGAESSMDFAETLLRLGKYSDLSINSFLSGLLAAGSDTTATTLEWALLELVRHPHVMERLQKEIDAKFGMLRPVDDDEAAQLPYLQAVVKEVLRLHPPAVLGVPHGNLKDAMLAGYHIPGKTAVIANLWAIHRDPNAWGDDALVFNPDRFLGSDLNVNGTNYQYLPFGAGRRICPGRALAIRSLNTAVGSFVHAFEWTSTLPGVELSSNEGVHGLNIRPAAQLLLRISLRPAATLYQFSPSGSTCNA